jgi:hypothetical protein
MTMETPKVNQKKTKALLIALEKVLKKHPIKSIW